MHGCAAPQPTAAVTTPSVIGYSGMTLLDPATYLVIHDFKSAGPGLGLLHVAGQGSPPYEPLEPADWPSPDRRATDLEAVCALPSGGFLAAESGSSSGREGRIFHFELSSNQPRLHRILSLLPSTPHPHNFEGIACASRWDGTVLLLLGERGGLKVETLAGPPAAIAGSVLSFATDDEHYGGVWRPLHRALTDCDRELEAAIPTAHRAAGKAH